MRKWPVLVYLIFYSLYCFGQPDPGKVDSLGKVLDSNAASLQAWQDSFQKSQDSIYRQYNSPVKEVAEKPVGILSARMQRALLFLAGGICLVIIVTRMFTKGKSSR